MTWTKNPVYVYAVLANVLALVIGFGVVAMTDVQEDLILKTVAAIILMITGVSVPAAKAVNQNIVDAFDEGIQVGMREY